MQIIEVPFRAGAYKALFSKHVHQRIALDAVLNSDIGVSYADNPMEPKTGFIRLGEVCFLAGEPHCIPEPELSSKDIYFFDSPEWKTSLTNQLGNAGKVVTRFPFSNLSLDKGELSRIIQRIPSGCELKEIDLKIARNLNRIMNATCIYESAFPSPSEFVRRGFGFCLIRREDESIASSCTTADVFQKGVEIQVNTPPQHRGKGYAKLVSAAFLIHCLETGISPNWDARTSESSRLAISLGFVPLNPYEVVENVGT